MEEEFIGGEDRIENHISVCVCVHVYVGWGVSLIEHLFRPAECMCVYCGRVSAKDKLIMKTEWCIVNRECIPLLMLGCTFADKNELLQANKTRVPSAKK